MVVCSVLYKYYLKSYFKIISEALELYIWWFKAKFKGYEFKGYIVTNLEWEICFT